MKKAKLLAAIRNNPDNVRYSDICKAVEYLGFAFRNQKGSHRTYSKPGVVELVNFQNVKGMAKAYQVRQFLRIVDQYGLA
ncbi:MAG: type II toxin-antitoxin system HicA family toxin [Elusimicrobia bacterium]|nr:type II toxin-antitoxin system HicA family toxin [Elusimicrobiota bacterium]